MATASVTLSLNNSAFLAGMARARSSVSALGSAAGGLAAKGLVTAGAAVGALSVATAVGIKKAFDFGGKLADMSAISGKSVGNILLLRRALEDAGVSAEKIDRYVLAGVDRGKVIERALKNMTSGDWADAARSVGRQAEILDKNAKTFDRVSDLLGRTGGKLQGFFVGAANAVSQSLLPFLEKFDKMDFAAQGEQFGAGLLKGAQALAGFFNDPSKLFQVFQDSFTSVILGIGNLLVAVFTKAVGILQAGAQAAFESINSSSTLQGWRKTINSALLKVVPTGSAAAQGLQQQIDEGDAAVAAGKPFSNRMLEIANENKLEVKDLFGAGNAAANAQEGIKRAAAVGATLLPTPKGAAGFGGTAAERAAAGEKHLSESQAFAAQAISNITVAGADEFETRWGQPKPADADRGRDKDSEVPDKVKEAMEASMEKYWGSH